MNYLGGLIFSNLHRVVRRTGRGAVFPLVVCMVLGVMFCPLVLADGVFDNATIASDGPAIAVDGVLGDAGPVHSFSHAIGGASNRILLVGTTAEGIGVAYDTVVTSVTYGGTAMNSIASAVANNGPGLLTTLYYLLHADLPAAGSYTVEVTYSTGPFSLTTAAISLSNFVQQAPEAMATSAAPDNTGTTTANITTVSAGAWLINMVGAGDYRLDGGFASSSGMTTRDSQEIGTQDAVIATLVVPVAGAQAITWTYVTPNRMGQVVAAFEAIPPIFSILPEGGTREIGDSHTFEVALFAPVGTVSHQWKKDGGDVGTDSPTLDLTDLQIVDSGEYWVVVSDGSAGSPYTTPMTTLRVVEELPTANLWALIALAALLLISGTYFVRRRLAPAAR